MTRDPRHPLESVECLGDGLALLTEAKIRADMLDGAPIEFFCVMRTATGGVFVVERTLDRRSLLDLAAREVKDVH